MSRIILTLLALLVAAPAAAQGIIRDAEIEADLREIADPIFRAAGLNPSQVRIITIGEDEVNAFVAGGQNLFLYTGLILKAETVDELAGVIAHESGHMAGGHLVRMKDAMARASVESILATIAGVAIGVGAGDPNAGVGAAMGGGELARRNFLRHSRTLESSADQAALSTLDRLGYSSRGMADFLQRLSAQEILPEMQRSPYILTHPLSYERMNAVRAHVEQSPVRDKTFPLEWEAKFKRMKAKILAFTQPAQAQRVYASQSNSVALYATAIADYRQGNITAALKKLSILEKTSPDDPYLADLRGQILFEQGRIAESIAAYRRAVQLAPKNGLLHLLLAKSLLQKDDTSKEALRHLYFARENGERDTSMLYRYMATAYGRMGDEGSAKLALAEEALLKGDRGFAVDQAKRAKELLKDDKTAVQRADDIIAATKKKKD
jgi:predicted Zn-dependent protease